MRATHVASLMRCEFGRFAANDRKLRGLGTEVPLLPPLLAKRPVPDRRWNG